MRPYVLGIGGTTRPGSTTELALRHCVRAAETAGAEVRLLCGHEILLPMYAPEMPDRSPEARRLVESLRRCDGLIIASPGYHGSISGMIKNALDYAEDMCGDNRIYLEGCAVGCIACAYGWQATGMTLMALRAIVHALRGWPTPMAAAINSSQRVFDADGRCIDPAVDLQLTLVGRQVVEFAEMRLARAAAIG